MCEFSVEEKLSKVMNKISKKDPAMYNELLKKIDEIINYENINHYKNLRKPLQHLKRVHIKKSFVLTFRYIESEDRVLFYDFDHHDNIYKKSV